MTGGDTTNKGTKFGAAGVELQENEAYGTSRVTGNHVLEHEYS